MKGFNLLPEEYKKKKPYHVAPITIIASVLIALAIIINIEMSAAKSKKSSHFSEIERHKMLLERRLSQIEQRRAKIEGQLKPLLAVIADHPVWSNLLIDISKKTDGKAWITQLFCSAENGHCTIQGYAPDSNPIFEFIDGLKNLSYLKSVNLTLINSEVLQDKKVVNYEISCRFTQKPF